jgi:deoxyuridine 5'-triphosphate nucleotidohydrolase
MSSPRIIIEKLFADVVLPSRATEHSAGYDLYAYLNERPVKMSDGRGAILERATSAAATGRVFEIQARMTALIPLGFKARLPEGFEAQIRPRSGNSFKRNLMVSNSPGTIDADYPDEWMVLVRNLSSTEPLVIQYGERVAQMIIARFETPDFVEGDVAATTSRKGGLGSTGA